MTLGERIKKLRRGLDLTQQEFAGRIGTTQNSLAGYETGRRNPSSSVVNNICKTFHVNEEWLKTGFGEMFEDVSRDDQINEFVRQTLATKPDSFQRRFAAMLSTLSDSDWEVLERMAYTIIEERPAASAPTLQVTDQPDQRAIWEAEARAEAEEYYREILEEKRRAGSGSASSGSDTSGTA